MKNIEVTTSRMKKEQKLRSRWILPVLIVMFALMLTACTKKGAKAITVSVVDADGKETVYESHTDAEFLKGAMDEIKGITLEGYDSDYGFFISGVNGLIADYEKDGAYWSVYVNGEYGMNGIDTQPVADGDSFKLAYEVYVAE